MPFPVHELRPERTFRFVLVVRAASQPHPVHRRPSASRQRVDMVEFEKSARFATIPGRADEGALALIPLPDRAPDLRRDVTAASGRPIAFDRTPPQPASGGSELPFLELRDPRVQRPLEHLSRVAVGNGVTQQLLCVPELVAGVFRDCELEKKS